MWQIRKSYPLSFLLVLRETASEAASSVWAERTTSRQREEQSDEQREEHSVAEALHRWQGSRRLKFEFAAYTEL
ncbi:hypothetical protein EVAR_52349_1 [Eumeta japonica]|uniref:Secreted protein n=1 Tax=Eumeta variegata TaxID=151549 RepID=A0A4C1Y497_EUMVA|nr:hypothetical protein EVAR_52349_1 [Eumeta japonica]